MLQNIREKLQGWVAIAMLLLIAVPLALTFVGGDFTISGSGYAARVNGEEIPQVEFQRVYQNRLIAEQQASGGNVSPAAQEQLKRQTLDGMVLNRVVTQYVHDGGFRISPAQVIEQVQSLPIFQVGGQFSKAAYDATLASQGISPTAFEREQQDTLAIRQLQDGLGESAFFTPQEYRRMIALDLQRRDVAYAILDPQALGAGIKISDEEVQAYYAANGSQFQTPESVDLEYLEVDLANMARNYVPDEAALRAAYEADPTRFRSAEERHARHILITPGKDRDDAAARALAEDIEKQLRAGADFAQLATKYSDDSGSAAKGGDLGFAGQGTYATAFEDALWALKPGETSQPVKTEFGYHIIHLDAVRAGAERSFDAVRAELSDELSKKKAADEFYALAEHLDDLALENPTSLDPVAKATGLAIHRMAGFSRTNTGSFGDHASFTNAVFSPGVLEGSENTPLIELDETHAVVARVGQYRPAAPKPLADVREEIVTRLRAEHASADARARGVAIVKKVKAGETLVAAVDAAGLKLIEAGPLTRRSPTVPADLLMAVFRAPAPDKAPVIDGTALGDGGYAIFELRAVLPGTPEDIPQDQRDQRKQALAQRAALAEVGALAADLRDTAKVVVAPDLFKADDEG